jgi:hypothetical protein
MVALFSLTFIKRKIGLLLAMFCAVPHLERYHWFIRILELTLCLIRPSITRLMILQVVCHLADPAEAGAVVEETMAEIVEVPTKARKTGLPNLACGSSLR